MGIIQKQTIKGSVYSYLGVAVGFLNSALIMPMLLSTEEYGLINILVAISAIYAQFSSLGFATVTIRLFPYFRNADKNHNGYAFITVMVGTIGFLLALAFFFILKPYLIENNIEKSPLLVEYIWFLVPLIFFRSFFLLLDNYNKVMYDATTGTLLSDFAYRLINLLLLGAYFLKWINFPQYVMGYTFALCFPAIYLAILLIVRGQFSLKPQLQFISKSLRNEMISVAAFGIIGGLSGVALQSIDKIMVNGFLDLNNTGIYSISFFFGTIILIPSRALAKISSPILADSWKENDLKTINSIYYQSSINQSVAGCILFILLIANLHNIFQILPAEYTGGEMVILYISLGNLIAVSSGVSLQILGTSEKYKILALQLGILIILTIITNLILIPIMGINGAALASLISMVVYTIIRILYLKRKMNLFPYNSQHLKLILITVAAYSSTYLIPEQLNWIIDTILRSSVVGIVFGLGVVIFKISDQVNDQLAVIIRKLKS
ncbi:lipopolysaccharide biosynthesis protein [Sunxiuqinia sp. A32]|uniref:lipopolysaccharide biosynthesis protein n=1 Tax=Sunxiuqinia sp. A32 TaxID=3461496 RepID=UPI0040459A80